MPEFAPVNRRGFFKFLAGAAASLAIAKIAPPAVLAAAPPLPAPPRETVRFRGRTYTLDDETIYVPREAYMLEFFAYETVGGVVGCPSLLRSTDVDF